MAILKVGNMDYQCATTDAQGTWPTPSGAGYTMTVINKTTKTISAYYYYDGSEWILI